MSAPRHRIRRLVLEVTLRDERLAWPLQSELSRIQSQSIEGLIDRCCTEIGAQDRLHRIESLVVDVGEVSHENLERELIEKLEPLLRKALAVQIQKEDEATALSGDDPETLSQLELVAFFAHTGSLPWWADASKPKLVDETLGLLLRRATRPLVAVVRTLARERADLSRIILHCEGERLSALFAALAASSSISPSERSVELDALLQAGRAVAGIEPARFRNAVWLAALRAACIEESWSGGPVSFWRGALAHLALELGVTYRSLLTGLHANRGVNLDGRPDPLGMVVQSLYRELRGEVPASDSVFHRDGAETAIGLPAEALGEARRLVQEQLAEVEGQGSGAEQVERTGRRLVQEQLAEVEGQGSGAEQVERTGRRLVQEQLAEVEGQGSGAERGERTGAGEALRAEETEAIQERLERWGIPIVALFEELRAAVPPGGTAHGDSVFKVWRDLDQQAREHGPSAAETGAGFLRLLRQVLASQRLSQRALWRILGELEHAAAASLPAETLGEARRLVQEQLAEVEGQGSGAEQGERTGRRLVQEQLAEVEGEGSGAERGERTGEGEALLAEETEAIQERLERWGIPIVALFEELRAAVPGGTAHGDSIFKAWRDLDQLAREHGPSAAETGAGFLRLLRRALASQRPSQRALRRILEELEHAAAASLPAEALGEARRLVQSVTSEAMLKVANKAPSLDLTYSESDEIYVENAGLVILWPFLGHAFERLELTADKQFKDRSAQHRAVGLLQYLVTEDGSPPEFQLPLAKVLCGLRLAEVFEFGPPVTEVEAEECANLLAAVIANAPILKEMSIAGFRGSFLLRKGVLSTRDGTWLLRVARAPYDVVLDRFPWGMGWVKLPWMEAPLCVEW
ncbi:contractile injection system tape measure protein [Vitiosangium sp. GDMCC 1.1324]|uniref:contractile injection system tape measure protein n=1 Tax=Vitiosangium sp. (strain GDMCC 1.1324) TaxID=2138576 RepID=UPI000D37BA53|nr:contractile injection system tape measure protein [Vitiosangium sp. GDMCC 1.1324]PTL78102.1 hypothetical protein DAT35_41550 [Vitiosangium sp. GDMCC 1.1324]